MKFCIDCKIEKSLDDFYKNSHRSDGLHVYCKSCTKTRGLRWRTANIDKVRERSRLAARKIPNSIKVARVQKSRLNKINRKECLSCSAPVSGILHCPPCQEIILRRARDRAKEYKKQCFDHYGRVCACCKQYFNSDLFLTLNHINNDGAKHRREAKLATFYRWSVRNNFPESLETNCWNCNSAKGINGGICPHQLGDSSGYINYQRIVSQ